MRKLKAVSAHLADIAPVHKTFCRSLLSLIGGFAATRMLFIHLFVLRRRNAQEFKVIHRSAEEETNTALSVIHRSEEEEKNAAL